MSSLNIMGFPLNVDSPTGIFLRHDGTGVFHIYLPDDKRLASSWHTKSQTLATSNLTFNLEKAKS